MDNKITRDVIKEYIKKVYLKEISSPEAVAEKKAIELQIKAAEETIKSQEEKIKDLKARLASIR
jgi:hypothetical protein